MNSRERGFCYEKTEAEADLAVKICEGKLVDDLVEYELKDGAVLTLTVNGGSVASAGSGSLRILSDRTIAEAFINEGRQAVGIRRTEEQYDDLSCTLDLSGQGTITRMSVFEMKSIW